MKIDWVEIPSGDFVMGLSIQQIEGLETQVPMRASFHERVDLPTEQLQRIVHLDTYWIARTPVTYAQMTEFVATGHPYADPGQRRKLPNFSNYPMDHAESVLWHTANAFCSWINARLPTAPEWEKAARGVDGRFYPWGDKWDASRGNFGQDNAKGTVIGTFSSAVGLYLESASPYGVLDMIGNNREWTLTFEYDPRTKMEVPVVKGTCAREEEAGPPWLVHRVTRHRAGSLVPEDAPPYTSFRPLLDKWQRQFWQGIDLEES